MTKAQQPGSIQQIMSSMEDATTLHAIRKGLRQRWVERSVMDGAPMITLHWIRQDDLECNINLLILDVSPPYRWVRIDANVWKDAVLDADGIEKRFWLQCLDVNAEIEQADDVIAKAIEIAESVNEDDLQDAGYNTPFPLSVSNRAEFQS